MYVINLQLKCCLRSMLHVVIDSYRCKSQTIDPHEETLLVKLLIPSSSAGIILGKGGETIICLQTQYCTNIKLSKAGDFFPGTMDRVCVILGTQSSIRAVVDAILTKIREKPDSHGSSSEMKLRLVVPCSTAELFLCKGGSYLNQIQRESGARVQVAENTNDRAYLEQIVCLQANRSSEMSRALDMVLTKIFADPGSNSCPNVSYTSGSLGGGAGGSGTSAASSMHTGIIPNRPSFAMLRHSLRLGGYQESAIEDVVAAVYTLASYGFLTMAEDNSDGSGSTPNLASILGVIGHSSGTDSSTTTTTQQVVQQPAQGNYPDYSTAAVAAVYGSNPYEYYTSMAAGNSGFDYYRQNGSGAFVPAGYPANGVVIPPPPPPPPPPSSDGSTAPGTVTEYLEVGEHVVGAVLGPGGKSLVDLQMWSGATVEISKKGVFAPGTRNRIVTVSGTSVAVQSAMYCIRQSIAQEEMRRATTTSQTQSAAMPQSAPGQCAWPSYHHPPR